jgi:hypothetical protein
MRPTASAATGNIRLPARSPLSQTRYPSRRYERLQPRASGPDTRADESLYYLAELRLVRVGSDFEVDCEISRPEGGLADMPLRRLTNSPPSIA